MPRPASALLILVTAATLALHPASPTSSADRPDVGPRSHPSLPPVTSPAFAERDAVALGPSPLLPSLTLDRAAAAAARATAASSGPEAAIDQCVMADMARLDTPGAAVAVLVDGQLVHSRGYGVKHRRFGGAVDADTVFRVGSITKMMTAAAVMQQVDAGRVDLDDPVTRHVPEFAIARPFEAEDITVRHLLTHSTGFPDLLLDVAGPVGPDALARWAGEQDAVMLYAPPGEFWNYANPNYNLAGLVAERAAGLEYHQLMATRVWGPAGMPATTLYPAEVMQRGNWSYGHVRTGPGGVEVIYDPDDYDNWPAAPAGFAFSTAPELVRWALLLMDGGGPVLSSESAAAMQQPQVSLDYRPDMYYGLGIFTESYRGLDVRQHGGNVPGWGSILLWVPESRFAVAVLGNTFDSLTAAAYCVMDVVLRPTGAEAPDDTTDPATWERFVGHYEVRDVTEDAFQATVGWLNNAFLIRFTDRDRPLWSYSTRLVQAFHDTFIIDSNGDGALDMDLTFIRSGDAAAPTRWLRYRHFVGDRGGARRQLRGGQNS